MPYSVRLIVTGSVPLIAWAAPEPTRSRHSASRTSRRGRAAIGFPSAGRQSPLYCRPRRIGSAHGCQSQILQVPNRLVRFREPMSQILSEADGPLPDRSRHHKIVRSPIVAAIATAAVSALLVVTGCALAFGQGSNGANPAGSSKQCAISPVLVNSCRAWLGAAAAGNPGAPPDSVSQFTHLEKLVGHSMDVYRGYDNCGPTGCTTGTVPLAAGSAELHFALRANTYVDINWKPATTWSQVDGSD